MMNRKIIFSPNSTEQYEIHRYCNGYLVYRFTEQGKISQIGDFYRTSAELIEGLVQLAIFNGEEDSTLEEIGYAIQSVADSINDHCSIYAD